MFLKKYLSVNGVTLKEFPFLKELAMEAFLVENEDVLSLTGFEEISIEGYEIHVTDGGKVASKDKNGRLDILASYGSEYAAVIELKAGAINADYVAQLEGYLRQSVKLEKILLNNQSVDTGSQRERLSAYKAAQGKQQRNWLGVLVGTSIEPEFAVDLRKGNVTIKVDGCGDVPILGMTLKRYRDDVGQVYVITDLFMPEKVKGKDYSKYEFEGELYTKGRLVLAVVTAFLRKESGATFSMLEKVFPAELQGSIGVFTTKEAAEEIVRKKGHKRHFLNPGDTLRTGDGAEISICSQWGKGNIGKFIEKAKELGFVIEKAQG